MLTESNGCEALETFISKVGAPFQIMSDNTKIETGKVWKRRKYNISSSTAPYRNIKTVVKDIFKNLKRLKQH